MSNDKKEIPQNPELILEQVFVNLNNLKEALRIQANKNGKIEPIIIPPDTPRPLPIPPLDPERKDGDK